MNNKFNDYHIIKEGLMIPAEFKESRVRHEVLEICYEDLQGVDQFINEDVDNNWRYRLTQAQDVTKWIGDPRQIEGIKSNLKDFKKTLKKMMKPVNLIDLGCYGGYIYDYIIRFVLNNEKDFFYTGFDVR